MERVLIAEDDNVSRKLLEVHLKTWNYQAISVANGTDAWEILQRDDAPELVILDWMMPGMAGVEICEKFRELENRYAYIILLTAKGMVEDVVKGLEMGADDYVKKPFDKQILQARLKVGQRVVELERIRRNQVIEIQKANQKMKKELEAAASIQRSLLPQEISNLDGYDIQWHFQPSSMLGGDMLDVIRVNENVTGFYVLDVSGHGTQAAMLSVAICHQITNILTSPLVSEDKNCQVSIPATLIKKLVKRYGDLLSKTGQYFTILIGSLDHTTGAVRYVRAGHPSPVHIQNTQEINPLMDDGGLPIGMFEEAEYQQKEVLLEKGDRFLIYTDGLTEAKNEEGEELGEEGLIKYLKENDFSLDCKECLVSMSSDWQQKDEFDDDVTLLGIHRL
jgi:sigma-B regulation protein RsbU (phosphoserine phosphatase)